MKLSVLLNEIKEDIFNFGMNVDVSKLELVLEKASYAYYNTSNPILSDVEFDILYDFLVKRKPKSDFIKKVGTTPREKVKLDYFLGSMDKIKPPSNKLGIWKKKYKGPYILSDKLDGISGLCIYNDNKIRLFTRGTALEGMDITRLVKYLGLPEYDNIEKKINKKGSKNLLAVRGEIIMKKSVFKKYEKDFKNGRNLVSGVVNSKNIEPRIARDLDFVVYEIVDPFSDFNSMLKESKKLGFKTVYNHKEKEIDYDILNQVLKNRKSNSEYEIDGVIVSNMDEHKRSVSKNPEYAFAFKDLLEDQIRVVNVKDIEWNISKNGMIKPVVLIDPVELGGVTISRVSGFNGKYISENNIGKGSILEITRSGDVIPYILRVIKGTKALMPNIGYIWSVSGVDILIDEEREEQEIKRIYFFFKSLNVRGFGERLIEKLYLNGYISIESILKISKEDLIKIEGIKEKSADNYIKEIKKLRERDIKMEEFILSTNSLGDNIGSRKALSVISNIKNFKKRKPSLEELIEIDGIEEKTGLLILENYDRFRDNYKKFRKLLNIVSKKEVESGLKYKYWVLSGFRDMELSKLIESLGGVIENSVSNRSEILVVKDRDMIDNPTTKIKKGIDKGIKIITRDELDIEKMKNK